MALSQQVSFVQQHDGQPRFKRTRTDGILENDAASEIAPLKD